MKICCQLPISMPKEVYASYYEVLMQAYRIFKEKDTEIVIRDVPTGLSNPELISYFGFRETNDIENVKAMIHAEEDGFDGISGACYFDSGIKIASSLMSIPVVGASAASMHFAGMIGSKLAVVTSEPTWIMEMEHHMVELGFKDQAIQNSPVRSMTLPMNKMFECLISGNVSPIIDDFKLVAAGCLEDGADVIIAGCGLVSPVLTVGRIREIDGAVVIDPMIASLKMTELLVNLRSTGMRIKSMRGLYQPPPENLKQEGIEALKLK
jgi:Asp/Glu/hydantoin racemase